MKVLVTGGAGFIGSHIAEHLIESGHEVIVYDNLSSASADINNIKKYADSGKIEFIEKDLLDKKSVDDSVRRVDMVVHCAANPVIRPGVENRRLDLEQNTLATFNILDAMATYGIKKLFFTSSSAVYGDALFYPTKENEPLKPISPYGASKVACEAMVQTFSYLFGWNSVIFRLAEVIGGRIKRNVAYDFVKKLTLNPKELNVMGDGGQVRSFAYIDDFISAFDICTKKFILSGETGARIFNHGTPDALTIKEVAQIVIETMDLKNVKVNYGKEPRGWPGDVLKIYLSTSELMKIGWKSKFSSRETIKKTTLEYLEQIKNNKFKM